MTAVNYTSRVVELKFYVNTFEGDSWIVDSVEHDPDSIMLTADYLRTLDVRPIRVGEVFAPTVTYSGYIAGVKTAIQLSDTLDVTSLSMYLYDQLTGVLAAEWPCIITGEDEETPIHGLFQIVQVVSLEPVEAYTVTTAAGAYRFDIVYTEPTTGFVSTIMSGMVEILPAVPS